MTMKESSLSKSTEKEKELRGGNSNSPRTLRDVRVHNSCD
jgi:hypothetical protein